MQSKYNQKINRKYCMAHFISKYPFTISIVLGSIIFLILLKIFTPVWETNDDVTMSMILHGYGIAAFPSPNLVFSNIIYGYIISYLPVISNVLPYSYMTLVIIVVCIIAITYYLKLLSTNYWLIISSLVLIFSRLVAMPQFTVNAGLLTIASVLGVIAYLESQRKIILITALCLGFLAYLIRYSAFFFIIMIALPVLPYQQLRGKITYFILSITIFASCAFIAWYLNDIAYQTQKWYDFMAFNPIRVLFADYGYGDFLAANHPELIRSKGLTLNDMRLLRYHFFADPNITNVKILSSLAQEAQVSRRFFDNIPLGINSVKSLFDAQLTPLWGGIGICWLFLRRKFHVLASIVILVCIIFILGIMGRPAPMRVCYPAVTMILFISLIGLGQIRNGVVVLLLFISLGTASWKMIKYLRPINQDSIKSILIVEQALKNLHADEQYIMWGASFPYEQASSFFVSANQVHSLPIYSLGVFFNAPFAVSYKLEHSNQGLIKRLLSDQPVPFFANDGLINLLSVWCNEHYKRKLNLEKTQPFATHTVYYVSCGVKR